MNRIPNKISYHLGIADSKRQTAQQHPPPLLGWRWSPRDAYAGGWPRQAAQNGSCKYALPAAVWPIVHPSLPTGNHQRCNRVSKGCVFARLLSSLPRATTSRATIHQTDRDDRILSHDSHTRHQVLASIVAASSSRRRLPSRQACLGHFISP